MKRLPSQRRVASRRVAERLLDGITELHSGGTNPAGCLELNTAQAGSKDAEPIWQELLPLPPGMTSDDAASLIISLIQGLAVQAKAGVSRETARRVVRAALLSWPES